MKKELAIVWVTDFLDLALKTNQLKDSYEKNEIDIIQDNYLHFYVFGMPGRCPHLIFDKEFKYLTEEEVDTISSKNRKVLQ